MKSNHHIEDTDWELIAKSIYDGNSSEAGEDSLALSELIPNKKEREQLMQATNWIDLYFEQQKYTADKAWEKVDNKIHTNKIEREFKFRKIILSPGFRIAAVFFAFVLLISSYLLWISPSAKIEMLEISSADQVMNKVELPDGTIVSLNSNTKIVYPEKFDRTNREVTIEGEAFFEVKPNKRKPFIIHAGKAQIQVLGTSFNVSAYPELKQVEVIVETGKVQVSNKVAKTEQTNELILIPGDRGTLIYSSNSLLKTTNQDPNFLSWKTRHLIFKSTSLGEVIRNLEKVYKVEIHLADPRLSQLLLTAQFNNYSLDFIMEVIETTFQIEAKNVNGQYILKNRS